MRAAFWGSRFVAIKNGALTELRTIPRSRPPPLFHPPLRQGGDLRPFTAVPYRRAATHHARVAPLWVYGQVPLVTVPGTRRGPGSGPSPTPPAPRGGRHQGRETPASPATKPPAVDSRGCLLCPHTRQESEGQVTPANRAGSRRPWSSQAMDEARAAPRPLLQAQTECPLPPSLLTSDNCSPGHSGPLPPPPHISAPLHPALPTLPLPIAIQRQVSHQQHLVPSQPPTEQRPEGTGP